MDTILWGEMVVYFAVIVSVHRNHRILQIVLKHQKMYTNGREESRKLASIV